MLGVHWHRLPCILQTQTDKVVSSLLVLGLLEGLLEFVERVNLEL